MAAKTVPAAAVPRTWSTVQRAYPSTRARIRPTAATDSAVEVRPRGAISGGARRVSAVAVIRIATRPRSSRELMATTAKTTAATPSSSAPRVSRTFCTSREEVSGGAAAPGAVGPGAAGRRGGPGGGPGGVVTVGLCRGTRGGAPVAVAVGPGAPGCCGPGRPGLRQGRPRWRIFLSPAWASMFRLNRAVCRSAASFCCSRRISASRAFISAIERSMRVRSSAHWGCSDPQFGQDGAGWMVRPQAAH